MVETVLGEKVLPRDDAMIAWVAGVVHDAVQQAVMQCGYVDELFQDWRDGKIGEKGSGSYPDRGSVPTR